MVEVVDITFNGDGNSASYVGDGWGGAERHGRWTMGSEAHLVLRSLIPGFRYSVQIILSPYLAPPTVKSQKLEIFANDIVCHECVMGAAGLIQFDIPVQAVNASRRIVLSFRTPDATAPKDIGPSKDVRRLGFSIWKLVVETDGVRVPTLVDVPLSRPQRVAAVTMVYNEPEYLPVWLRHYGRQVGLENCYIVDHGSDDGSTDGIFGCNIIKIPRSPYDPVKQSLFNSEFCSSLLQWFDWVIYSDVDELMMADPKVSPNLSEYCRRPLPDVVTAIGLNSAHRLDVEPELNFKASITQQRPYVFTASSMCKPNLFRVPISWSPGSHSSDADTIFDHLYLFHLRWVDLPYGLRRLHKTRAMAWARTDGGRHQRVEDEQMTNTFRSFGRLPIIAGVDFDPESEPVRGFVEAVLASRVGREKHAYKITLDLWGRHLWPLPQRFMGSF